LLVVGPALCARAQDILNANSFWRWHVVLRLQPKGAPAPRQAGPSAADDWMKPTFDDFAWPRGQVRDIRPLVAGKHHGPLRLRARFRAADPAAVRDAELDVQANGRVTVYLNGRTQAGTRLRASDLRTGCNVLAVEVAGPPVDLKSITLRADGGLVPKVARPDGFQVWSHDLNDRVCVTDYGDPCEAPRIRIAAARNTAHAGQVVLGAKEPIERLAVEVGDLKPRSGGGVIPAGQVTVLYGRLNGQSYGKRPWCDGLSETVPDEIPVTMLGWKEKKPYGARVPIWLRVRVPEDAVPGDYRGSVRIAARGMKPVVVPVELSVADWICPDPREYRTYVGIYQSPTTLALQYKVDEWSERHWALMDRSFALLARAGNTFANVTVVEQTQFGNDRGMVIWIRQPDGTFEYDFRVFDRYMELVQKHFGTVDYVAVHVWHSGGWEVRKATQKNTVTVVDKKTGERSRMQVPTFGTDESKRFWKPVLDALRARLRKLGMEEAFTLGILSDGTAPPSVLRAFDEIVPGKAHWMRGLHRGTDVAKPYPLKGGGLVSLHEHCYGMSMVPPFSKLPPVWSYRGRPGTAYFRVAPFETRVSHIGYRIMAEQALFTRKQGVGRIGLDFWSVLGSPRRRRNLYNRYPHSSCAQRAPALYRLTWPGPEGAETTTRFELFCEGVQEAEAMIVISKGLDRHAYRLGPELARRCRRVLRDRLLYCHTRNYQKWSHVYYHMNHYGWRDLARRTYACAGEVARTLQQGKGR
jgi:hypothetical protein